MPFEQKQKEIQAILFAAGEPLELKRLAQAVELGEQEVRGQLEQINEGYRAAGLPFCFMRLGESVQMCTEPEYAALIRQALEMKRNTPLSQAAFEVLAIVAYNQPVTRAFVEQVRGVDSSGVMNALAEKGLVEEAGRLELPGRPIAYQTTESFLRCFSLSSLEELPQIEEEAEKEQPPAFAGSDC